MSHSLLIYIGENIQFDFEKTIDAVCSIENVYGIDKNLAKENKNSNDYHALEFDFKWKNEHVSVSLDKSHECFFVKNFSTASLVFAYSLQKQMASVDLLATDVDYSFVCQLNKISSMEEFEKVVAQHIHMDKQ